MKNAVWLEVQGLGHVPSFKNNKMMTRGRLITNPKRQQWMQRCIRSFEYQLSCYAPTTAAVTLTEPLQRCWIASSLPLDDSWQWIPDLHITARKVKKGWEGATITIERL